jgi:TonB family protein
MSIAMSRLALLGGFGLILSADPAQALQACREPFYSAPRPTAEAMALVYPKKAMREHVHGQATLNCAQRWDGRLDHCVVKSESPRGYGFAQAALRLAAQLRTASPLRRDIGCADARTPHRRVDTTIRFNLAG